MKNIDKLGLLATGYALCTAMIDENWIMIPVFIGCAYCFGWVRR